MPRHRIREACLLAALGIVTLSGCGNDAAQPDRTASTGSFASSVVHAEAEKLSLPEDEKADSVEGLQEVVLGEAASGQLSQSAKGEAEQSSASLQGEVTEDQQANQPGLEAIATEKTTANAAVEAPAAKKPEMTETESQKAAQQPGVTETKGQKTVQVEEKSQAKAQVKEQESPVEQESQEAKSRTKQPEVVQGKAEQKQEPPKKAEAVVSAKGHELISWAQFFDNELQNTPSERFWDLSEQRKTVTIKGYMGEVLSMEKRWFLLIPAPGAECPFDNGDETYWNKIMIVYVPDHAKLRYTTGPLEITGRLDVGVKVDESGYKTMFRLYDAEFNKLKE